MIRVFSYVFSLLFLGAASVHAEDASKLVRVGYQKSGALLLVKNEGTLEKALKPKGYEVVWTEFTAGPPLIEALNAGSLDLGHSGEGPVIFAQATGVPLVYLGNTDASPDSAAIVVPKDSPLKTVADLKGKQVAFAKGSSAHYLVAKALESAGLTFADIKPVYLSPPDGRAAFQAGKVGAWGIWDPFFAAAEVSASARVLVPGKGLTPHREFYFGRKEYAEEHPEVVAAFLDVLNVSGQKAESDPKATAAFLANKLGLPLPVLERSELRKKRYYAHPLTPEIVAEQQGVADLFLAQGLIKKPIQVASAVYRPTAH